MSILPKTGVAVLAAGASLAFALGTASPVGAQGPPERPAPEPEELVVSGSFTATGTLVFDGCGNFHHRVEGSGDWSGLGSSMLDLDFCIDVPSTGWAQVIDGGTFSVTSDAGMLSGTVTGEVNAYGTGVEFPFRLVLTVTAGTGDVDGASGALVLEGAFGLGAGTAEGNVSGELVIPPGTPPSMASCRHGGWRSYVDDEGRGFFNQGQCIVFALRSSS